MISPEDNWNENEPRVSVVVLNWNKAALSARCVTALMLQSYINLRVIVVDNGSESGSLGPLIELDVPFRLLRNARNMGFTGGVNTGIAHAMADGSDFIWLLNNDAEPERDTLTLLVDRMVRDEQLGLVSPLILNADENDEVEFCGGIWDGLTFATTDRLKVYQDWQISRPAQIWLVGTALLIRSRVIDRIGVFDQRFFAYWEDNDFSVRSIQAGYRNAVVSNSIVRHWSGRPKTELSSKPPYYHYYMARNEILFIKKHGNGPVIVKLIVWAIDRQFTRIDTMRASQKEAEAIMLGLRDGMMGVGGAYNPDKRLSWVAKCLFGVARRMFRHRS